MRTNGALILCKWQPELASALLGSTADVYLVLDDYDVQHGGAQGAVLEGFRQVYRVSSFDSLEEVAAVAADLELRGAQVSRVLSHTEFSQFGAGYLEVLLGLTDDPLRHVAHRDKRLMKKRVRAAGVRTADFASLPDPADRAANDRAAAAIGGPMVVKPAAGFGTMSTLRVEDAAGLAAATADFRYAPLLRCKQLIVEEYVPGTELIVDALWADRRALTFVVHAYQEPRLSVTETAEPVGLDGSQVLPESEHRELYDRLREAHDRINGALGIQHGATHLEIFLRPDGELVFSEIGTRLGGAWCPDLLTAHLGHSIWDLLAEVTVHGSCPPPKNDRAITGALHVKPARPGVISRMPGDAELAAFPGVVGWRRFRKPGDEVHLAHPSEWCLFLVLAADTTAEYDALRLRAARELSVETQPA
jgi:biotin carboxylase